MKPILRIRTRTIAAALMICSLLVMTAGGQINNQRKTPAEVVLQDDTTGNYLLIDLTTGEYRFNSCQTQAAIGGHAKVSYSGCSIAGRDVSETRMVLAEVDLCSQQGRAIITIGGEAIGPPALEYTVNDKNIRDSVAECEGAGK